MRNRVVKAKHKELYAMIKKIFEYVLFPVALLMLLFVAIPSATAADLSQNKPDSVSVLPDDKNPALSRDVKMSLGQHKEFDTPDIQVKSKDNTVTLTGKVNTREDRERVEEITRRVKGVGHIINDIELKLPEGDEIRDTQ